MLANQGGLEPFFDQPLARPRDRVDTGLQRRRDLAVAPALTTVRGVGFQQDPGLQQLLCWMVSAMDQGGEMLSLLIAQCHYVFLYRDLFPGHQSTPSAATEPSNQTNTAESMTGATSGEPYLCGYFADMGGAYGEKWLNCSLVVWRKGSRLRKRDW